MRGWICWIGVVCLASSGVIGCGRSEEAEKARQEAQKPTEVSMGDPEPDLPENLDDSPEKSKGVVQPTDSGVAKQLILPKFDLSFALPATWKRVPSPPTASIIQAEFEVPKVKNDEVNGRLTLVSSGGSMEDNLKEWQHEFEEGTLHDSKEETLTINGKKATWVELHGTWHGRRSGSVRVPRKNFRLVVVAIPLSEVHACYVKLTGPQDTVAAHEAEFRAFVNSAKPLEEEKVGKK